MHAKTSLSVLIRFHFYFMHEVGPRLDDAGNIKKKIKMCSNKKQKRSWIFLAENTLIAGTELGLFWSFAADCSGSFHFFLSEFSLLTKVILFLFAATTHCPADTIPNLQLAQF